VRLPLRLLPRPPLRPRRPPPDRPRGGRLAARPPPAPRRRHPQRHPRPRRARATGGEAMSRAPAVLFALILTLAAAAGAVLVWGARPAPGRAGRARELQPLV